MDYYPGGGLFSGPMSGLLSRWWTILWSNEWTTIQVVDCSAVTWRGTTSGHHLTGSGDYSSLPVLHFIDTNKVVPLSLNQNETIDKPGIIAITPIVIFFVAHVWMYF